MSRSRSVGTGTVGMVLGLVAALGVVVGSSPAYADTTSSWQPDQRPGGLPATEEPARTLATASVRHHADRDGHEVSATVELGGVPDEATDAQVVVGVGDLADDGSCVPTWQASTGTLVPTAGSRDGAVLRLRWTEEVDGFGGCALVSVRDPEDGTVLDTLVDPRGRSIVSDPVYRAELGRMTGQYVRPGRWEPVRVTVVSRSDVRGFSVHGGGKHVQVRGRHVGRSLASGERTVVTLEVRSGLRRRAADFDLVIGTDGSAFGPVDRRGYRLVPRTARG